MINPRPIRKRVQARRLAQFLYHSAKCWENKLYSYDEGGGGMGQNYWRIILANGERYFKSPDEMRSFAKLVLRSIK